MRLTRREVLKLAGLSALSLAMAPYPPPRGAAEASAPYLGRVARGSEPVRAEPDPAARWLRNAFRNELLPIYAELTVPAGAGENPRWYRLEDGYISSAHIQRVEGWSTNRPLDTVPEEGCLAEVTVPASQSWWRTPRGAWKKLYLLYFGSVHWITGLEEVPGAGLCYRVTDEWLRASYYAPAADLRPIAPQELSPIALHVPAEEKRVEVSISGQLLTAYEGNQVVLSTRVSTGLPYMETPVGEWRVDRKCPSRHMGNGAWTADPRAYELPGVSWAAFFHPAGVAFHGTYWHNNFGAPMSHGCVNMPTPEAKWLFRWLAPAFDAQVTDRKEWTVRGEGTRVSVIP